MFCNVYSCDYKCKHIHRNLFVVVILCWLSVIWVALTFISPLGFHRVTFVISVCISYYSLFCHGIPIHLICLLLVGLYCLLLSFCINKLMFCSVLLLYILLLLVNLARSAAVGCASLTDNSLETRSRVARVITA